MTNTKPIENARDSDLRMSLPALRRAAQRARDIAQQTGTSLVVSRNGVLEYIKPDQMQVPKVQEPLAPYVSKKPAQ